MSFFDIVELRVRQSLHLIPEETTLLVTEDPVPGIGSGGATLNALLVVTEYLAAKAGYTVSIQGCIVTVRRLYGPRIYEGYMVNTYEI